MKTWFSVKTWFFGENTQENQWDYAQQNCDWAVLKNPQIGTLDQHFENTTMTTYKINIYLI